MSTLPPLLDGAVQLTVALLLPALAVTSLGADGVVAGVTALDGDDVVPAPFGFAAWTVKV